MREGRAGHGPTLLLRMIASRPCRASPKTPSIVPATLSGAAIHCELPSPGSSLRNFA